MSKAEEEAIKRYPKIGLYDNMMKRKGFIEGYHQAGKDLELTWEDIKEIYFLFKAVLNEWYGHGFSDEGICREVLKRFKAKKNVEQEV